MGNLFGALVGATGTLRAFTTGLNAVQTNISNVNTPGYAKQTQSFQAMPFDIGSGLPGGVRVGDLANSRNEFAEKAVRRQQSALGYAESRGNSLAVLEPVFTLSENSGVQAAINRLYTSFSQLSVSPNSAPARQNVLSRATEVASQIQHTAHQLSTSNSETDRQVSQAVQQINTVLERIQTYNRELRSNAAGQEDPGIDANMHAAFEELSGLVSFDILKHDDGSVDLLLGGQTPVLVGDRLYPISAETNNLGAIVRDAQGHDITATLTKGELGAILEVRNVTVPGYQADLDRLASTLADRINGILAGGLDLNGNSPIANLFTYDPSQGAASTLALNNLSTDDLAAASSTAPGGNGNALELAKLANSKEIDGFTLIEFYGSIGGRLGRDIATAREGADTMTALVSQAKTFREEVSGVSLDEEAAKLLQFQRSYEAAARLVKSLDEMTQSLISILS